MKDDAVSQYVLELQQRYPQYRREHAAELREIGTDALGRVYQEYFLFRSRTDFESQLHSMLTAAERDLLQTDQTFTRAWNIFVDMVWIQKRVRTAGILIFAVLALVGVLLFAWWALPYVAGPQRR